MTTKSFNDRAVHVIGIGMHRYQFPSDTPYVTLGLTAVREALSDAGLAWRDVQSAVVGTAAIGMAAGRVMLRHLGSNGISVTQVENASASGSAAFRLAALEIYSGAADVVLAVGVDKFGDGRRAANKDGLERLGDTAEIPVVKFALQARRYCQRYGATREDLARVAVKNHANAALNPNAQFQKPRTLEQILASPAVVGDLTSLQCCPRGEGAAAAILVSDDGLRRLRLNRKRAVSVLATASISERLSSGDAPSTVAMVRESGEAVYRAAGIEPRDLNLVELHDAFSIEELLYAEALGICAEGEGAAYVKSGAADIGGRCAINSSGGLIGMGHPIGPTGIGQIVELVRQLRGEAGRRQHAGARLGLAHMIGLGSVAIAHVLKAA